MKPSTETGKGEKPKLAYAIATAGGVGYLGKAPGTLGSLVGVATIVICAIFFLRPTSLAGLSPFHVLSDARFMDKHFLVPGSDIHNTLLILPIFCAFALLFVLGRWSLGRRKRGGVLGHQRSAVGRDR